MSKIIIDCDAGVDDAMALLMAFEAHKNGLIHVCGVTSVRGNADVQNVNRNIWRTVKAAGLLRVSKLHIKQHWVPLKTWLLHIKDIAWVYTLVSTTT